MTELRSTPTWNPDTEEWEPNLGGGGGGSSPSTASQTFTINRAGGFVGTPHTFDLGSDGAHPVQVTLVLLSFVGDGESLGNGSGTLYVGGGDSPLLATNSDNAPEFKAFASILAVNHFVVAADAFVFELQDDGAEPSAVVTSARYLQLSPQLVANDTGETYAGANDPVASIRVDLIYT